MATMIKTPSQAITRFSLKDAPSLIERLWPAQKISAEAMAERLDSHGQSLPGLGSYWKGRKPLVLVRACVLASLLPATANPERDLEVFEALMRIDDSAFGHRANNAKAPQIAQLAIASGRWTWASLSAYFAARQVGELDPNTEDGFRAAVTAGKVAWAKGIDAEDKVKLIADALSTLPYSERLQDALRPEELLPETFATLWPDVNRHLGTSASSLGEVVQQLGEMRFGRVPLVADTFAGGGSIPFEAARLGCDVFASDLNPIACMLTWGGLNIIGSDSGARQRIEDQQKQVTQRVDREITELGFEHDEQGNRAKAFLYCLETRCPASGWLVPILPSLIISKTHKVIARLVPDPVNQRYDIAIVGGADADEFKAAHLGTLRDGHLIHSVDDVEFRTSIKTIRGDFKQTDGTPANALRPWAKTDVIPQPEDIFQERLYCIQWTLPLAEGRTRAETIYAAPTARDLDRERNVNRFVMDNVTEWQEAGYVPDMRIEPGEKTNEPIRTRGWTYWHHLFNPRQLLVISKTLQACRELQAPASYLLACNQINLSSRLSRWGASSTGETKETFSNQALNTIYNYGCRGSTYIRAVKPRARPPESMGSSQVKSQPAKQIDRVCDLYVTDPPYADAVVYHEITEFFISWLRDNPPAPFDQWTWDARRPLAIKGEGEAFRQEMVAAYGAMAQHMPDNGIQIVMFTHQSGSVWADMAQIFWGAGLQVRAAWYIATETTSQLKQGGYVQGTVILVLRKRGVGESGYEDEIAQEVRAEVARQIDTLVGLNQQLKGSGRIENLFEDADLQMAGYAAALRVLTGYTRIDGRDMTAEAGRPRKKGEQGFVERIIDYAVQVANEHMVPTGLTPRLWQSLTGTERFYLKMVDLEGAGLNKLDNYQNFARAFRVPDYNVVMADVRPNSAKIKGAADFKRRTGFEIPNFGEGPVRAVLYGVWELSAESDPDVVVQQLREMVDGYYRRREDLIEIAEYIASQRGREDQQEGRFAALLANLLRNEKL